MPADVPPLNDEEEDIGPPTLAAFAVTLSILVTGIIVCLLIWLVD